MVLFGMTGSSKSEALNKNLSLSKKYLVYIIKEAACVIAFLLGMGHAVNLSVKVAARDVGYCIGVIYLLGVNILDDKLNGYELKRHHVDLNMSKQVFRSILVLPVLFD
jgi:hypothetical protein